MSNAVKLLKHFEAPKEAGLYYRLVCLTGKDKGQAYFLMGKRVVLGRSDIVDIRVMDIKSSREHAEIIKVGKDFVLTDLGSQNGIIINDLKIKQHVLSEGDKIIIGKTVYKFNKIEVKPKVSANLSKVEDDESDENDTEDEPKSTKTNLFLGLVAIGGIAVILLTGEDNKPKKRKSKSKYNIQEVAGSVSTSMRGKKKKNKEAQRKMNIYFQKGLREFREYNYFRAMSEFEHALAWSPSDPQAMFYLRKTQEALDKTIDDFMLKGARDAEALKFHTAVVSYCQILRLLYMYPNDQRYKDAKETLENIEAEMGLEKGDIECIKEIK